MDNGKVISFMNMKGGVGKTTLCVNLAHCLCTEFGKRVLIIDLDPQSNATQYVLKSDTFDRVIRDKKTIYEIYEDYVDSFSSVVGNLEEDIDISPETIIYKITDNLNIIPGNLKLIKISMGVESTVIMRLKEYIDINNLLKNYDYIFIDCPPTQSIYTSSALLVSDYYIMPVKPDFLSSIGIDLFKAIINKHNRTSPRKVKCLGIVFTLVQNYPYYKEVMERIRKNNAFSTFDKSMPHSSTIPRYAEEQQYLYDIPGYKNDIIELTSEFLENVGDVRGE